MVESKPKAFEDLNKMRPKLPLDLWKYSEDFLAVFRDGGISRYEAEKKKKEDIILKGSTFMEDFNLLNGELSLNFGDSVVNNYPIKKTAQMLDNEGEVRDKLVGAKDDYFFSKEFKSERKIGAMNTVHERGSEVDKENALEKKVLGGYDMFFTSRKGKVSDTRGWDTNKPEEPSDEDNSISMQSD